MPYLAAWRERNGSGAFRSFVFDFFLEWFPDGFIPNESLFVGLFLAGDDIA